MRVSAPVLVVSHPAVAGGVYTSIDRRPVDNEVKHTGFMQVDTTRILSATVESLRDENRLLVFTYKGKAEVEVERTKYWLLRAWQRLSVPAVVPYQLDLADLTLADVTYEERAKLVRVKLPRVTLGDVAFEPEKATTINGGILTWGDDQVEALRKLNYASARKAMVAQAQQKGLLNAAKRQAVDNIESYFSIPLRIAGQPDVKVVATFDR